MKIVVIGGSGLIGAQTVEILRKQGHDVLAASPRTGVNAVTGEGLQVIEGADVLIDCSNSPSFEEKAVFEFFDSSTRNLLAAAKKANIKHYVALSVVGTERLLESPYFRAKMAQETQIKNSNLPYTIVQATQFYEFLNGIAQATTVDNQVRLTSAKMQPIAALDVAEEMVKTALAPALNATLEIAGPERFSMSDIIGKYLKITHNSCQVIEDDKAAYFGIVLKENSLTPADGATICATTFDNWMSVAAK